MLDPVFWKGRKVLLTGHTGFKGAWMTVLLGKLGAQVTGVSLNADEPSLFGQADLASRIHAHRIVDLRDSNAIKAVVDDAAPEIVIHFAAQSLVREAYRQPVETFATNVMGTVNLLEALRSASGLQAVLTATTDKVYFNAETGHAFAEKDALGGVEPYSASKAATEWVVAAYRRSYQAPNRVASLVARAGNIIGGGDWSKDRLIPDFVRAAQAGQAVFIRNPGAVRPWQFVVDALIGYLMLIEYGIAHPHTAEDPMDAAYNFGPSAEQPGATVAQVCEWMAAAWPGGLNWTTTSDNEHIQESHLLYLDSGKANRVLGWRPTLSPREAVLASIAWYAAAAAGESPFALCEKQIEDRLVEARN